MKYFATFFLLLFFQNFCFSQTSLKKAYREFFIRVKDKKVPCESAFKSVFQKYYYSQNAQNGVPYYRVIEAVMDETNNTVDTRIITDFSEYPVLFLATYVCYEFLAEKGKIIKDSNNILAEKWKMLKKATVVAQYLINNQTAGFERSNREHLGIMGKRYARKCKNCDCIPDGLRRLNNTAQGWADKMLLQLKDYFEKEIEKIEIAKHITDSIKGEMNKRLTALGSMNLKDSIAKFEGKINQNPFASLLNKKVDTKSEKIDISNYEIGKYCTSNIENSATDYAKPRLVALKKLLDAKDELGSFYVDVANRINACKQNYPDVDIPVMGKPNFDSVKISATITITGKADGQGGCHFENWTSCPHISTFNDDWKIDENIDYTFNAGDVNEIWRKKHITSGDSGDYILKRGSSIKNISLAFLRGYCVGINIKKAVETENDSRYKILFAYQAKQYTSFSKSTDRAFLIKWDFINYNEAITSYQNTISDSISKLEDYIKKLKEKIKALEVKLDGLEKMLNGYWEKTHLENVIRNAKLGN